MTEEEFEKLTDKLQGRAKYLYFHLMGEPTLHPLLPRFIDRTKEKGFLPILTTNGSLLSKKSEELIEHIPYKVSISLHAPEANPTFSDENYLSSCLDFAKKAADKECIVALRLWNLGSGADNSSILSRLHSEFPNEWAPVRRGNGERMAHKIFLEWGDRFDWPDNDAPLERCDTNAFCYALRDQVGVLVDGTVVPCCLDADGCLALGNLFENELEDILSCPRAKAIYEGFSCRRAVEPLCQSCGFIKRFK